MRTALSPLVAGLVLAGLMSTAPTAAADPSAREVIDNLRDQGYEVIVDRIGNATLENCAVTSIRNPKTVTRPANQDERDDLNTHEITLWQTITVSLDCT